MNESPRTPAYRPRRPRSAPSQGSAAERDAFAALVRQSLPEVRKNAEAWRNGLAAFLTLVTTGVIIKGRDTAADLPTGWKIAVTLSIGGGLMLAVAGLWQVLAAQAGTRHRLSSREDLRRLYGSVDAYQVAMATRAGRHLNTGRRLVAVALLLLLIGVGLSWWAPTTPRDQPSVGTPTSPTVTRSGRSTTEPMPRAARTADDRPTVMTPGGSLRSHRPGLWC